MTRVVTVTGAFTKKTDACLTIAFANGSVHQQHIKGAAQLRQASAWVARYNGMAGAKREPGQVIELGADGVPSIGPAEEVADRGVAHVVGALLVRPQIGPADRLVQQLRAGAPAVGPA
jgi:hypothetical protein